MCVGSAVFHRNDHDAERNTGIDSVVVRSNGEALGWIETSAGIGAATGAASTLRGADELTVRRQHFLAVVGVNLANTLSSAVGDGFDHTIMMLAWGRRVRCGRPSG